MAVVPGALPLGGGRPVWRPLNFRIPNWSLRAYIAWGLVALAVLAFVVVSPILYVSQLLKSSALETVYKEQISLVRQADLQRQNYLDLIHNTEVDQLKAQVASAESKAFSKAWDEVYSPGATQALLAMLEDSSNPEAQRAAREMVLANNTLGDRPWEALQHASAAKLTAEAARNIHAAREQENNPTSDPSYAPSTRGG